MLLNCYGVLSPLQEQVAVCLERFWCSSWDDHIFWEKMPMHGSSLYVSLSSWSSGGFCSYQQTPVPPQEDLLYNDYRLSGGRQGAVGEDLVQALQSSWPSSHVQVQFGLDLGYFKLPLQCSCKSRERLTGPAHQGTKFAKHTLSLAQWAGRQSDYSPSKRFHSAK